MEKLVIDRSKWRTGGNGAYATGKGLTKLLNREGYMCCLGFECLRRGALVTDIYCGTPCSVTGMVDLGDLIDVRGEARTTHNSDFAVKAMNINDNVDLDPENREGQLADLFAAHDIEVEFIGSYENL